ncbi:MAG: hypothetical protein AABX23_03360 [Nanoarchaeota archaeon]
MGVTRRRFLGASIGMVGGAMIGRALGSALEGIFGVADEVARDFTVIYKFEKNDRAYLDKISKDLPIDTLQTYQANLDGKNQLYQGAWDYIESLQRQALKLPGAESKPVKKATGLKDRIFEWTKGKLGEKSAKEAQIQVQEDYIDNYNNLARLRASLMERINDIEYSLNETAYKILANEHNTHDKDRIARSELIDGLFSQHNVSFDLLRQFRNLTPEQVLEGIRNEKYLDAIQKATEYGIKPYEPHGFLTRNVALVSTLGVAVAGAVTGGIVGNKAGYTVSRVAQAGKDLTSYVAKMTRRIVNILPKKRGRKT